MSTDHPLVSWLKSAFGDWNLPAEWQWLDWMAQAVARRHGYRWTPLMNQPPPPPAVEHVQQMMTIGLHADHCASRTHCTAPEGRLVCRRPLPCPVHRAHQISTVIASAVCQEGKHDECRGGLRCPCDCHKAGEPTHCPWHCMAAHFGADRLERIGWGGDDAGELASYRCIYCRRAFDVRLDLNYPAEE